MVWDGGGNHKGPVIREFLAKHPRLHLERLPPWAPDHNPVEQVWSWRKWGVLANYAPEDIDTLDDAIGDRLVELRHDPKLLRSLWLPAFETEHGFPGQIDCYLIFSDPSRNPFLRTSEVFFDRHSRGWNNR